MAMTLYLHDPLDEGNNFTRLKARPAIGHSQPEEHIHLLRDKIAVPTIPALVGRPRVDKLLGGSLAQYPGTLVSGRSGTGKTAAAVQLAGNYNKVAWYTLDALDADWEVFKSYFSETIAVACGAKRGAPKALDGAPSGFDIVQFLVETFTFLPPRPVSKLLIVIDDLHHIFDASWFEEFFQFLLVSMPVEAHLLLLCRSKPPNPLWRLRSKQVLNVVDEKLLAYTDEEAADLLKPRGMPTAEIQRLWRESFGRPSKLVRAISR